MSLSDLDLDCGVSIRLRTLHQTETYLGLVEGRPRRKLNDELLERLPAQAKELLYGGPTLLIDPERRVHSGRTSAWGPPEELPAVICFAQAEAFQPARDSSADMSSMILIWLQPRLAPPIDDTVLPKLKAIDWRAHARDGNC